MINDEIVEFAKCNKNDSKFEIEMKSKALYTNFIIIKLTNCNLYYIFINYI